MKTTRRSVAFMALLLAVCLLLSCAMAENQREIDTSRDSVTIAYNNVFTCGAGHCFHDIRASFQKRRQR